MSTPDDNPQTPRQAESDLLREQQEGKGYGEDEGERDAALDRLNGDRPPGDEQ